MRKKSTVKEYIVKTIPASESGSMTTCKTNRGTEFIITNNPVNGKFTLWKIHKDDEKSTKSYEKIAVSNSPLDFDKIIYS